MCYKILHCIVYRIVLCMIDYIHMYITTSDPCCSYSALVSPKGPTNQSGPGLLRTRDRLCQFFSFKPLHDVWSNLFSYIYINIHIHIWPVSPFIGILYGSYVIPLKGVLTMPHIVYTIQGMSEIARICCVAISLVGCHLFGFFREVTSRSCICSSSEVQCS